jgi:hypothetical protein
MHITQIQEILTELIKKYDITFSANTGQFNLIYDNETILVHKDNIADTLNFLYNDEVIFTFVKWEDIIDVFHYNNRINIKTA